jgi:hypothetical protein
LNDKSTTDDDAIITVDTTSHTDAVNGITSVALTATQTNISPGTYKYNLRVEGSDTLPLSTIPAELEIIQSVTERRYS